MTNHWEKYTSDYRNLFVIMRGTYLWVEKEDFQSLQIFE